MTMIVTLGNSQNAILVSDRRLTMPDGSHNEESNKAYILVTQDARMAIGFSGLAEVPSLRFHTRSWLPEALRESASPDSRIRGMIERLKSIAERDISSLRVTARDRRLSITGTGYIYDNNGPRLAFFRLSNFESPDAAHTISSIADREFHLATWIAPVDLPVPAFRHVSGWNESSGEAMEVWDEIGEWLAIPKPANAIVSRTVKMIRLTADLKETKGAVGHQCMSVVISSDLTTPAMCQYHTAKVTPTSYMPDFIVARGEGASIMTNFQIEKSDGVTPVAVPQVPRNHPCPCESGQKYKYCHGRNPTNHSA